MRINWLTVMFLFCVCAATVGAAEISKFDKGSGNWKFSNGGEFKGAKGAMDIVAGGKEGSGLELKADFTGGGRYVAIYQVFDEPIVADKLSLWIKGNNLKNFMIRLADETGQTHQSSHALNESSDWQQLIIPQSEFASKTHWGGDNDGQWHGKVSKVFFMVEIGNLKDGKVGSLQLDEIVLE